MTQTATVVSSEPKMGNVARLSALSARLRRFPPEEFDLNGWDSDGGQCTACIAGHMPEFNVLGLNVRSDDQGRVLGVVWDHHVDKPGLAAFYEFMGID